MIVVAAAFDPAMDKIDFMHNHSLFCTTARSSFPHLGSAPAQLQLQLLRARLAAPSGPAPRRVCATGHPQPCTAFLLSRQRAFRAERRLHQGALQRLVTRPAQRRRRMIKVCPSKQCPSSAFLRLPKAALGRAWHSRGEAQPLTVQPWPRMFERATSEVLDSTAFDL